MPSASRNLDEVILEFNDGSYPVNLIDFTSVFVHVFLKHDQFNLPKPYIDGRIRLRFKWQGTQYSFPGEYLRNFIPPTLSQALNEMAKIAWGKSEVRNLCCGTASSRTSMNGIRDECGSADAGAASALSEGVCEYPLPPKQKRVPRMLVPGELGTREVLSDAAILNRVDQILNIVQTLSQELHSLRNVVERRLPEHNDSFQRSFAEVRIIPRTILQ